MRRSANTILAETRKALTRLAQGEPPVEKPYDTGQRLITTVPASVVQEEGYVSVSVFELLEVFDYVRARLIQEGYIVSSGADRVARRRVGWNIVVSNPPRVA